MRVNIETTALQRAKLLARRLGITHHEALGRLIFLWHWSQEELLVEATTPQICFWFNEDYQQEDVELIMNSLEEAGFISYDRDIPGRNDKPFGAFYRIHGNHKHVEKLKKWKEASKKGGEAMRAKWKAKREPNGSPTASPTKAGVATPNSIQFNSIQSNSIQFNSEGGKKPDKPGLPLLAQIWNEHCGKLPKVKVCNASRLKHVKARWKETPWNDDFGGAEAYWTEVVQLLALSKFCNGVNDRGWIADFSFFLRPETHIKTMEGTYSDRRGQNRGERAMSNLQELEQINLDEEEKNEPRTV